MLLARLEDTDLDALDDASLVEVAAAAQRLASAAHALTVRAASKLSASASMNPPVLAAKRKGITHVAGEELAMRLTLSRQEALSLIRQGAALTGHLVATGEALAAGLIDAAKAKLIVETLADQPLQVALEVETEVLPRAPMRTKRQLSNDLAKALISVDPDEAERRRKLAATKRRVCHARPLPDGAASMYLVGPAPEVIALDLALEATARSAKATGDARTMDQLRFDALALVGNNALATGHLGDPELGLPLGLLGGRRPEIQITVSLEHLLPTNGFPEQVNGLEPDHPNPGNPPPNGTSSAFCAEHLAEGEPYPIDPGQVPYLAGYGPLTPATARAYAAGGVLRRLVTDPASGTVLDLGRTRYRPTAALAEHLRAGDRTCVRPGCGAAAIHCDLDHTIPWLKNPRTGEPGGPTADWNLGPICDHDHDIKTHGGFNVRQVSPGVFEWTTPTGLRYRRELDGSTLRLGHFPAGYATTDNTARTQENPPF